MLLLLSYIIYYININRYWDSLRGINTDFFNSRRELNDIRNFLNQPELDNSEQLEELYFKSSLKALVDKLESDIDNM